MKKFIDILTLINLIFIKWYYKISYGKRLEVTGYIIVGKGFRLVLEKGSKLIINGNLVARRNLLITLKKDATVIIGSGTFFNNDNSIIIHHKLEMGNDVICGEGVKIYDNNHKIMDGTFYKNEYNLSPVKIGNKVWLANYVNILAGSVIHDNVVVGALSLVNKELVSNYLYVGAPCKQVKKL